jgi:hypothetical protein
MDILLILFGKQGTFAVPVQFHKDCWKGTRILPYIKTERKHLKGCLFPSGFRAGLRPYLGQEHYTNWLVCGRGAKKQRTRCWTNSNGFLESREYPYQ